MPSPEGELLERAFVNMSRNTRPGLWPPSPPPPPCHPCFHPPSDDAAAAATTAAPHKGAIDPDYLDEMAQQLVSLFGAECLVGLDQDADGLWHLRERARAFYTNGGGRYAECRSHHVAARTMVEIAYCAGIGESGMKL